MKTNVVTTRLKRTTLTALLCAGSLLLNACTTTNTAYQVQTQPMNPDLEKNILRETGLSGMAIGAGLGAVAGGVLGAVYGATQNHNKDQMRRDIAVGAAGGGVIGAGVGHQKGTQQGQQMVSAGMTRDKARQLVRAAQQENQRLAAFNAGLRKKIASAKAIRDPKERKVAYSTLNSQADGVKHKSDATIAMRKKALETKSWGKGTSGDRSEYQSGLNAQVSSNKALVAYMGQLAQLNSKVN